MSGDAAVRPHSKVGVPVKLSKGINNTTYVIEPMANAQRKLPMKILESLVSNRKYFYKIINDFCRPAYLFMTELIETPICTS